jgi:hypothetical protein
MGHLVSKLLERVHGWRRLAFDQFVGEWWSRWLHLPTRLSPLQISQALV